MTKSDVLELMKSSKNERDWGKNCDIVKGNFNGQYPGFWFAEVIQTKLVDKVLG